MKNIVFVLLVIVTYSCSEDHRPENIIDPERFKAIYVELLDSAAAVQRDSSNFKLSPTAARILSRHHATLPELRATVSYYNLDTKKWKQFYESVVMTVNQMQEKNTSR